MIDLKSKQKLRRLLAVVEELKQVDDTMSIPAMKAFLLYAIHDGEMGNRLMVEQDLGYSNATASRATLYWTDMKTPRDRGADKIEQLVDPSDRRARYIKLNRAGLELVNKLVEKLE